MNYNYMLYKKSGRRQPTILLPKEMVKYRRAFCCIYDTLFIRCEKSEGAGPWPKAAAGLAAFESEDAVSIHETMGTGLEFPPMEREGPPK